MTPIVLQMAAQALYLLPLILMFLVIPLSIGLYVYRDAKYRDLSAVLWTFIALLAPMLIGFIIYLLVRGSHSILKCPDCTFTVAEQFDVCPKCGAKLKDSCAGCEIPLEPEWAVCPKCSAPLTERSAGFVPPIRKVDYALPRVIFMIVLMTVLLVVSVPFMYSYNLINHNSGTGHSTGLSVEYFQDDPDVLAWIEKANQDPTKVYVLSYWTERDDVEREYFRESTYIIYRPTPEGTVFSNDAWSPIVLTRELLREMADPFQIQNFSSRSEFFGFSMSVRFFGEGDGTLAIVQSSSDRHANLRVYVDGQRVNAEITKIDSHPIMTWPEYIRPDADDIP